MFYISHSTKCHLSHLQTPLSTHSDILQTTIREEHVHSYLLSAAIPPVSPQQCTFMVSILSLSLQMLLMKSSFFRRWLSNVSLSCFCLALCKSNQIGKRKQRLQSDQKNSPALKTTTSKGSLFAEPDFVDWVDPVVRTYSMFLNPTAVFYWKMFLIFWNIPFHLVWHKHKQQHLRTSQTFWWVCFFFLSGLVMIIRLAVMQWREQKVAAPTWEILVHIHHIHNSCHLLHLHSSFCTN